jgi:hypothetical protein
MLDRRDVVWIDLGRFDDVARARPWDLRERHTNQRYHFAGWGPWRRHVVFIEKRSHYQVEHTLWVLGNVDEDEQIPSGARTESR